ncbi:MAG TPA: formyltetrahydrofolate deformylase [Nevskiaceae bacterium]|nr:formyltetrahydrofolate deformylase [Nevskiaceae bacterium]
MSTSDREYVLQFTSPDRPGVLAAITGALFEAGCNVRDAAQFGDPESQLFFVRMHVRTEGDVAAATLLRALEPARTRLRLQVECFDLAVKPRVLIAVSQHGHCLHTLLHKWQLGTLPCEIVGVVSNHETFRSLVQWYELPFHFLPVGNDRPAQERALLQLARDQRTDLLVLARYMQVLSAEACAEFSGRCINIHHSFLPGFKGAKPYHQAHARGVKLIGATAHYVTTDLDEGPIIEQDVRRVTHATTPEEMVELGRETEASVLARAVRWHVEHRVVLNGGKTLVFE